MENFSGIIYFKILAIKMWTLKNVRLAITVNGGNYLEHRSVYGPLDRGCSKTIIEIIN